MLSIGKDSKDYRIRECPPAQQNRASWKLDLGSYFSSICRLLDGGVSLTSQFPINWFTKEE